MNPVSFAERLAWSEFIADSDDDLLVILRARIPECIEVQRADEAADRSGTDYWAVRGRNLRPLSIDLKARSEDPVVSYGSDDLALELWSDIGRKVGWTRDPEKQTDYILWLWQPTRRFLLVPFPPLCKTFQRYWQAWGANYRCATQDSGGWQSQCVFVPRQVVLDKLRDWMNGQIGG